MRKLIVGIVLSSLLALTGCVMLEAEIVVKSHQKVIDFAIPEHLFAVAKATYPEVEVVKVSEENILYATMGCAMVGEQLVGQVKGERLSICLPYPKDMTPIMWVGVCELFNMKYISTPSPTSVLCEKTNEAKQEDEVQE